MVTHVTDVLGLIRKNREARGWTEYQLAERSGLPQSTISSWYQKGMTPSFSSLEKICDAFGLTLSQFFAGGETLLALTAGQRDMLDKWLRLSPAQQRAAARARLGDGFDARGIVKEAAASRSGLLSFTA